MKPEAAPLIVGPLLTALVPLRGRAWSLSFGDWLGARDDVARLANR